MAIRNIRYFDAPILRKKCKEVKFANDKTRQILDDMLDTLQQAENGATIAANQVGILNRLVVIDYNNCFLKLVNPIIIGCSGVQKCNEAYLSFPSRCVKTIRPQKVTLQAQNENGEEIIITGENDFLR